jgi:hypothetical protein
LRRDYLSATTPRPHRSITHYSIHYYQGITRLTVIYIGDAKELPARDLRVAPPLRYRLAWDSHYQVR